ncbi:ATP-binding cassette domain-containing protein [Shouchella patagoniensis]|uniref:ATP-binding cassette domain-containing protein n=1 Tax=Shouchella patagoniensis TaxID=228576 RepID=UPI001C579E67|nr:ATP-binding cassette domain-containing protein [Shouchella patagoniensis]
MLTIEEGWIRDKGPNNLSLPKHCMTVLIGRNGSGKTTVLKGLAKQLDLESGKLYYSEEWEATNYHHYVVYLPFLIQSAWPSIVYRAFID